MTTNLSAAASRIFSSPLMTAMKRALLAVSLLAIASPASAGNEPTASQFEKALSLVIGAAAPQRSLEHRERIVRNYVGIPGNKALAIELLTGKTYVAARYEDAASAGERALEGCELLFGNPCVLLIVNNDPESAIVQRDMPRLRYAGKFDVQQIPVVRNDVRASADVRDYPAATGPKAAVIHSLGIFSATGADAKSAQDTALGKCNAEIARQRVPGPCFVYAVNDNVIIFERRTAAR